MSTGASSMKENLPKTGAQVRNADPTSEVLREFDVAIHNSNTTVGQQQRKRRAAHTEGPVLRRRTGRVGRACPVTVDVRSVSVTIRVCICV